MTFQEFSEANRRRCIDPNGFNHSIESWDTSDWVVAVMGELGESANLVKKLNRERDGVRGNTETVMALRAKLATEIADTFIYLDLLAQSLGLDLAVEVAATWNAKSAQIGYAGRLLPLATRETGGPK